MPKYRSGSRFEPTELGLVKVHLKDMVEKKISGFIKTLNVYGNAPWLLHHDTNPLYSRNEWYYFVPRTIRGVKTVSRMVPGNGEGFLGGTWKSIGKKKEIKRNEKELMGYKRVLVFNKNVVGELEKNKTASWHMDEYSLHRKGEEYHDLVLCHVRLLNSAKRFKPLVPDHQPVDENNDNNNNVVLPNQEEQEAGFAMLDQYEGGEVNQHQQQPEQQEEQEDSVIPLHPPLRSNHSYQRRGLLEDIVYQNDRGNLNQHQQQQQEQEDSHILLHPSFQSNDNQQHYPLEGMAYHGAEGDMSGYGLMPMFNDDVNRQHEQQQHSPTPVLPPLHESNDNQEHCPYEDYAFDGEDDNLTFDVNELLRSINEGKEQEDSPALQSNVNQQQCLSLDTILFGSSQVENKDNTVLPNQEQQEAGFANHNNDMEMVEKEHGDDIKQHQQQQDQEQQHKDLPCLTLIYGPEWADLAYSGDLIMQNMDVSLTQQQQQEVEEELLQPVPRPQDSGVHDEYQVMPPLQSSDNHGQRPLVPSRVENNDNNNNTVVPNQVQLEAGFANQINDMSMVAKEHGEFKQHQQQQDQNDLMSHLLQVEQYPSWDDYFSFDGAEDDLIMQNMDESSKQQLQELVEDLSKLLQPVPQAQDSGVHDADQVMPKD